MRVLAVDFSLLFTMQWEAAQGGKLEDAAENTIRAVASLRDGYDIVVIACDAYVQDSTHGWRNAPSFRVGIDPHRPDPDNPRRMLGYKANRPIRPAPYFDQVRRTLERLHKDGCHVVSPPELDGGVYPEADDILGWLAGVFRNAAEAAISAGDDPAEWHMRIVSADMDLAQLVDDMWAIDMYSPSTKSLYNETKVEERYGVPAARIPHFKALAGDDSDNYHPFPGDIGDNGRRLPGVGAKTACKLLALSGNDAVEAVKLCLSDGPEKPNLPQGVIAIIRKYGVAAAEKGLALARLYTELPLDATILDSAPAPMPLAEPAAAPPEMPTVAEVLPLNLVAGSDPKKCYSRPCVCGRCGKVDAKPERASSTSMIASHNDDRFVLSPYGLEPREMQDAFWLAGVVLNARLFPRFTSQDQILVVLMSGRARGFAAITSLENAYVVRGQVAWKAQFIIGTTMAYPGCAYLELDTLTDNEAVCVVKRTIGGTGKERRVRFTMDEARKLRYLDPPREGKEESPWLRQPDVMLTKSVLVLAARRYFPDVVGGMYLRSERAIELAGDANDE